MDRPLVMRLITRVPVALVAALGLSLYPAAARGQSAAPDLAGLSLQDLMAIEVVATASKFPQSVREAPASITIVTAEEIHRFGYRTLAEALRSVRGFYGTYDRNYAYLGARGFARPGDYNTRLLLLVDGHRLNDGIYDMAPVGTDFPVDVSLIDRIEVIRGPGSALYGTNALFGVVNVVTKSGGTRPGWQVAAQGGTLATAQASAGYGRAFNDGRELLVSATTYQSAGQARVTYPEFGDAVVEGLDGDAARSVFGSMAAGRFSVRAAAVHRHKQVPTAAFDTVFGDDRFATTDARAFVSGVFDGAVGRGWHATVRLAYDYYGYQGDYPFDYGDAGIVVWQEQSSAHAVTGEATARRRAGRHLVTAGLEVRSNLHSHQVSRDIYGEAVNRNAPGTNLGWYVQDEFRPASWLLLSGGLRLDRLSVFGTHVTPRAAAVLLPRPQTAVKLLFGSAFRAPNAYERFYYNERLGLSDALGPEEIRSGELVWEETVSRNVRATVSAFAYRADQLIEQRPSPDPSLASQMFVNTGRLQARGLEAEVEARFDRGVTARVSHTFARVTTPGRSTPTSNSPRHLAKLAVQWPVSAVVLGVEGQYVGERFTIAGDRLAPFFVPSLTVSSRAAGRVSVSASVYNLFNAAYSDPGAEEHVQAGIRQDGRTALLRVRFDF